MILRRFLPLLLPVAALAAPDPVLLERGAKIFAEKCALCHQPTGLGAPPIYPPLAGSDFLLANRERAIHAVVQGLADPIVVNRTTYHNVMPAQILDDAQVAATLTFVTNSWGNTAAPFTAEEVALARGKSRFATYEQLVTASAYQPIPKPPEGLAVRLVCELPEFCTRLAGGGDGHPIYALAQNGAVYSLDAPSGALVQILKGTDYLDPKRGDLVTLGLTVDPQGRLLVVSNQKLTKDVPVYTNEVIIWRSTPVAPGQPLQMQPWFRTTYPQGVGGMNHGVGNIAFGPDGMLYVASGSRTDSGEVAHDPHFAEMAEHDHTSCIWKLDPKSDSPQIEVVARGIRNAYGFAWDGSGQLFTFSNGPDFDAGEEMDVIEPGRHYGFPYQFENWPATTGWPYDHTPALPPGLTVTHPVVNLGPAAQWGGKPTRTFTPHSSPGGAVWCGDEWPAFLRGGFLVPRFGNLLDVPQDTGFDLLTVHPSKRADGTWEAHVETVLAPLGRPLDTLLYAPGRVLVLEYTRPVDFKNRLGWLPGRIIELSVKP